MFKLKIKQKILCLTLVTGAMAILAFGTSSFYGLINISDKLLEWEKQSNVSASTTLENLSSVQAKHSLNIIAGVVARNFSERLWVRISYVEFMANRLTLYSKHPDLFRPRNLPEVKDRVIHSGEVYVNYGLLRKKSLSPEVRQNIAILSNIADYLRLQLEFYEIHPLSFYMCSKHGYSINMDVQDPNLVEPLNLDPEELQADYDLRDWDTYIQAQKTNSTVINESFEPFFNERLLSICVPYYDDQGFAGVAGLDQKISSVFSTPLMSKLLQGVDYFVLNHGGKIIYSSQNSGSLSEGRVLLDKDPLSKEPLAVLARTMKNGKLGNLEIVVDGTGYYLSHAPIGNTGWNFAVLEKIEEAQSLVHHSQVQLSGRLKGLRETLNNALANLDYLLAGLLVVLMAVIIYASIKQSNRFLKPILLLVARADEVSKGKLDRRIAIKTGDEFEQLADSFNTMTAELKKHMLDTKRVTAEKEHIATELNVATRIQQSMLPQNFPLTHERYDLYARSIPAKEVGGDFYDFYPIDADRLAVTIADVSGKGVPAALFMVISKTILKNITLILKPGDSLARAVDRANLQLYQDNHEDMFVTVFIGVLDLNTGEFTYVSAGHNPPLLGRKQSGVYEYMTSDDNRPMLGVLDDISYVQQTVRLSDGDTIFMYTDGVTEAMDAEGRQFGEERLLKVLNANPEGALKPQSDRVLRAVHEFVGKAEQSDDITMLALRYTKLPQA